MSESDPLVGLEPTIKAAELELGQVTPENFSQEGLDRLKQRISEFIRELTLESVRVARRHQSDSVSPSYVDRAVEHLTFRKASKWQKIVEGLGAIVLGIGFGTAGSMVQLGVYTTRGVLISLVCIVLGMPAFMFHIMKE
jgi:hypothetical protein